MLTIVQFGDFGDLWVNKEKLAFSNYWTLKSTNKMRYTIIPIRH